MCAMYACGGDDRACGSGEDGSDPASSAIAITALAEGETVASRADEPFANNGSVGIIAAKYESPIYWWSYSDIRNTPATATLQPDGTTYILKWNTSRPKYWPLDNSQLAFIAYSPYTDNSSTAVKLNDDFKTLSLSLGDNMPDVLYASANEDAATTPYSKTKDTISMGEFRHALSKLTVRVIPEDVMNPSIRVTSLKIISTKKNATLDLLGGDNGLQVGGDADLEYVLVSTSTPFTAQSPISHTRYLYPGTEDYTQVYIALSDGDYTYSKTYDVSEFINDDNSGDPITLVRALNAVLTFRIKSETVQNPDEIANLEGALKDWNYQGDFTVGIN